jgi:predicted transposase YbfD/YdcC
LPSNGSITDAHKPLVAFLQSIGELARYTPTSGFKRIMATDPRACQNGVVLGQQKIDSKSNEITVIPQLLDILELKGCIVTIDAMGCQRDIAKKIREYGADYVLALKDNQSELQEMVDDFFSTAIEKKFVAIEHSKIKDNDYGHGRIESKLAILWLYQHILEIASTIGLI